MVCMFIAVLAFTMYNYNACVNELLTLGNFRDFVNPSISKGYNT